MEPTTQAKYFNLANISDRCFLQLRNELHRDDELGAVRELYVQGLLSAAIRRGRCTWFRLRTCSCWASLGRRPDIRGPAVFRPFRRFHRRRTASPSILASSGQVLQAKR